MIVLLLGRCGCHEQEHGERDTRRSNGAWRHNRLRSVIHQGNIVAERLRMIEQPSRPDLPRPPDPIDKPPPDIRPVPPPDIPPPAGPPDIQPPREPGWPTPA